MGPNSTDNGSSMAMPCDGFTSPIARSVLSDLKAPDAPILPGCTVDRPQDGPVVFSKEMLQAYNIMRGSTNGMGGDRDDPLAEWIRLRGVLKDTVEPSEGRRDLKQALSNIRNHLQSEKCMENSPVDSIFELHRPAAEHEHIQPPPGMDFSDHKFSACCADFVFKEDDDDDEDQLPPGRISPCTFLAWAKDCNSWKKDKDLLKESAEQDLPFAIARQRPASPELCDTPPVIKRPDRWPQQFDGQVCQESGTALSPCYAVPSNPSVLWTAEGIEADRMASMPRFEDHYSRMDPVAAKQLQNLKQVGRPTLGGPSPAGQNEHYTTSEVNEAVGQDIATHHQNASKEIFQAHIGFQYAAIAAVEAETNTLAGAIREQTTKIRCLESEKETVALAVWSLKHKRLQEAAMRSHAEQEKRRARVVGHFHDHVRDLDYKHRHSAAQLLRDMNKKAQNDQIIQQLELDIGCLCFEVGKGCPEEVYEELSAGPGPNASRDVSAAAHQQKVEDVAARAKSSPLYVAKHGGQLNLEQHPLCAPSTHPDSSSATQVEDFEGEVQQVVGHGKATVQPHATRVGHDRAVDSGAKDVDGGQMELEPGRYHDQNELQCDSAREIDPYDSQGFAISPRDLAVQSTHALPFQEASTPSRTSNAMPDLPWMELLTADVPTKDIQGIDSIVDPADAESPGYALGSTSLEQNPDDTFPSPSHALKGNNTSRTGILATGL
ncbi:uncharacterized protein JN550_007176 [Neoarthrinium moseri]|uniref:uncharacterized protein n=1 Tax=Neoarthrinium moseri TaxID=1658444 RepID=UPI001FDD6208|nr:uncharacterized protein JN550_007176 [Neoarthrinium moseri]KAI1867124.1 hypothetical protein JN550_007176 [Neoarthrinium moseri]